MNHAVDKRRQRILADDAQDRLHRAGLALCAAERDDLIQQALRVAHTAGAVFGDFLQAMRIDADAVMFADGFQLADDLLLGQRFEFEALAPRENGFRNFDQFGGCENKHHLRRRLFQRFEQGVERFFGQHVHFVDDVNLEAAGGRAVLHVFDQVANFVDAAVGGTVDFQHVDTVAVADLLAEIALIARLGRRSLFAVERLGQQAGGGSFTDAAGAGKQVGVRHAVHLDGVVEGADDMLLPDQLRELLGPPFAGRYLKLHNYQ